MAKFYPGKEWDGRDRLETEYTALDFVWNNGVQCVPRPEAIDRDHGCAIYEFIDGGSVVGSEITASDIDQTAQFLAQLKELTHQPGSNLLPVAGDAGLSPKAVYDSIRTRLDRLQAVESDTAEYTALENFLQTECVPYLERTMEQVESRLQQFTMSFDDEVGDQHRTLSPSDFGCHNVLRRVDGRLVFIDFEYFGWDDPAKLVSDFLLHPANDLRDIWKRRFLDRMAEGFDPDNGILTRVGTLYPLIGLKWTLLLLNEFIPEHLQRRRFAVGATSGQAFNDAELQNRQLILAREMLRRAAVECEKFPYANWPG